MASYALVFGMCPNTCVSDECKILFVISHLRDTPMTWGRDIPGDREHPLRNNYETFQRALSDLYSDRTLLLTNENKLENLHQENSTAAYVAEFQSLVSLGLNDAA
jgi:hypothetical protein